MLNIFKNKDKNKEGDEESNLIKIAALLIHAAKVDENYSEKEKLIIINFLKSVDLKIDFKKIMQKAEKDEENSNQILEYTQEIKKNNLEFKKDIIKILWTIILSDNSSDIYESTLMRRIAGLLYVPDKIIGELKLEVLRENK
jgi:uncharacterized tellurite resistance protein B-like protein|tara:strand:- start:356 stop:781 length:426 start_codon:yes stop_codon:yes gene_type:complete